MSELAEAMAWCRFWRSYARVVSWISWVSIAVCCLTLAACSDTNWTSNPLPERLCKSTNDEYRAGARGGGGWVAICSEYEMKCPAPLSLAQRADGRNAPVLTCELKP